MGRLNPFGPSLAKATGRKSVNPFEEFAPREDAVSSSPIPNLFQDDSSGLEPSAESIAQLEARMATAMQASNFEECVRLRDQIQWMKQVMELKTQLEIAKAAMEFERCIVLRDEIQQCTRRGPP
jgi:excinuclease UvrABC nuclease subunit